jgi:hypothetical protein
MKKHVEACLFSPQLSIYLTSILDYEAKHDAYQEGFGAANPKGNPQGIASQEATAKPENKWRRVWSRMKGKKGATAMNEGSRPAPPRTPLPEIEKRWFVAERNRVSDSDDSSYGKPIEPPRHSQRRRSRSRSHDRSRLRPRPRHRHSSPYLARPRTNSQKYIEYEEPEEYYRKKDPNPSSLNDSKVRFNRRNEHDRNQTDHPTYHRPEPMRERDGPAIQEIPTDAEDTPKDTDVEDASKVIEIVNEQNIQTQHSEDVHFEEYAPNETEEETTKPRLAHSGPIPGPNPWISKSEFSPPSD